ncbi:Sel1-repeat containing protein [Gracilaria domingensis]|nr:Sel1-repeat containing protein [Gracilaria domingensis]
MHGNVLCYLQFGDFAILRGAKEDFTIFGPVRGSLRIMILVGLVAWEYFRRLFQLGSGRKLRQVPIKGAEVWVHWACAFASQGLQKWIREFEVAVDPRSEGGGKKKTGKERFMERGKYFGSEVLGSAVMHLWGEYGAGRGMSPMLWKCWGQESDMSDGRVVKQELLMDAVWNGECLPFGGSHWEEMCSRAERDRDGYLGYEGYRALMKVFIGELPVQSAFVEDMEKFDVNMLEWLTIILHMGRRCRDVERESKGESKEAGRASCGICGDVSGVPSVRSDEGVSSLCDQVGIDLRTSSRRSVDEDEASTAGNYGMVSGVPFLKEVISLRSDGNRLVTKVGELVDVWISLVQGDQIRFLVGELNDEWEQICLGRANEVEIGEGSERCEKHEEWGIRRAHMEMTKRRLDRRIGDTRERYVLMDVFVTFMGYRMESVRTVIGRWVEKNGGSCADELFRKAREESRKGRWIEFELSEMLQMCVGGGCRMEMLKRRAVQCRLIWEIQNFLERRLMGLGEGGVREDVVEWGRSKIGAATIMLFIVSFPGVVVNVEECDEVLEVNETKNECWISLECVKKGDEAGDDVVKNEEERKMKLEIKVMCGVQKIGVVLEIRSGKKCKLGLLWEGENDFKWEWWREAFVGRLEGMEAWQKEMGIDGVEVEGGVVRRGVGQRRSVWMRTITERKIRVWREWSPFRFRICRLELENEELLRELRRQRERVAEYNVGRKFSRRVAYLPVQRMENVCYAHITEIVLKHSCVVVRETLKKGCLLEGDDLEENEFEETAIGGTGMGSENRGEHLVALSKTFEENQALMLLKMAALEYANTEGLKSSVEILCGRYGAQTRATDALELVRSYIGTILRPSSKDLRIEDGREKEMEED